MENFVNNVRHWDCGAYRKKYADVKDMVRPRKLLIHAMTIGINEGREFVFDKRYFFPKNVIDKYMNFYRNIPLTKEKIYNKIENSISTEFFEENYTVYILRHMNDENTSKYWRHCHKKIRALYPNVKLVIIDDNSLEQYTKYDSEVTDVTFYYSERESSEEFDIKEFRKRGELLPYYYYYTYGTTKYALFVHDSVFLNKPINDYIYEAEYLSLWNFDKTIDTNKLNRLIFDGFECLDINKDWAGVFGGMCVISKDYLEKLNSEYSFLLISLHEIDSRTKRMVLERLLGMIYYNMYGKQQESLFGDITCNCSSTDMKWGLSWDMYQEMGQSLENLPLVKIWTGR